MLRYLPGIFLIQAVTLAVFWVNLDADPTTLLLRAGVPALLIATVSALWFSSIGKVDAERSQARLRLEHARDREKLQLDAERSKAKVLKQAQRESIKQERKVSRRANVKVGLAFMGVTAAGVLMLLTELLTLGLLTITTAGGAMGGYLLRWRQASRADKILPGTGETKVIGGSSLIVDDSSSGKAIDEDQSLSRLPSRAVRSSESTSS
ncbi:MAG: hypothetical protein V3U76_13370 [Granulosicoccus sp.]